MDNPFTLNLEIDIYSLTQHVYMIEDNKHFNAVVAENMTKLSSCNYNRNMMDNEFYFITKYAYENHEYT